jgi:hypothetical protein
LWNATTYTTHFRKNYITPGAGAYLEADSTLGDETVVFRMGGPTEVRRRQGRRLKEQHIVQVTRYLDILRKPNSNCYLKKSHKVLPETAITAPEGSAQPTTSEN